MNHRFISAAIGGAILFFTSFSQAQTSRGWQQRVEYSMYVDMDAKANQFSGTQKLRYYNHSPDTLDQLFYHLYFNAFQPGSMMDVRSRTLPDADSRVGDRISHLKPDEIGYQHVEQLSQDGQLLYYHITGTVMKVKLNKPLLPGKSTILEMQFDGQVPLQIRRSGRDNREGIRLSMTQWFPKLAEYDASGWHADDYVGREFYAPWGDFDVKINIDSDYTVAATGVLQNPQAVGKGYAKTKPKRPGKKVTYHFVAKNVHDFAWVADTGYKHTVVKMRAGLDFHFFYQTDTLKQQWEQLAGYMKRALPFIERRCGKYAYPVYTIAQGGDGGMEYPMLTLITGHRTLRGLVGVAVHEFIHSWYQMMLATDESHFYWMDEGFTSYYTALTMDYLFNENYPSAQVQQPAYDSYQALVASGLEEPLTTHADHFETNRAYGVGAYRKGALLLSQLSYIMGQPTFERAMLRYYHEWRFRHPTATDFERVMEKESTLDLSWFFDYWIKSTKTIDYAIKSVSKAKEGTTIELEKEGLMPMPIDVVVRLNSGKELKYYIPLGMMRGARPTTQGEILMTPWTWVHPFYSFTVPVRRKDILAVVIDPSYRVADMDLSDNLYAARPRKTKAKSTALKIIGTPQQ